jgi:hypothetical protein
MPSQNTTNTVDLDDLLANIRSSVKTIKYAAPEIQEHERKHLVYLMTKLADYVGVAIGSQTLLADK